MSKDFFTPFRLWKCRLLFKLPIMFTSVQCRMARAALDWTIPQLAERSQVGKTTIIRFERAQSEPNPSTRAALRRTFEAAGIAFEENGAVVPDAVHPAKGAPL